MLQDKLEISIHEFKKNMVLSTKRQYYFARGKFQPFFLIRRGDFIHPYCPVRQRSGFEVLTWVVGAHVPCARRGLPQLLSIYGIRQRASNTAKRA